LACVIVHLVTKPDKSHIRASENTFGPANTSDTLAPLLVRERGWGEGVSDHLGSTNITLNASGTKIAELRYMPWGSQRYSSGSTPMDYRYTGQRQHQRLGLYHYQTRWYDPLISRFVQADTIVPNPASPLSFDRYMYANNSPLVYTDPSGHIPRFAMIEGQYGTGWYRARWELAHAELWQFGVRLTKGWSERDKEAVVDAVKAVGSRLEQAGGGATPWGAFRNIYNTSLANPLVFRYGNCPNCNNTGGYTYGARLIAFASLSSRSEERRVNNVIHELGHAFDWAMAETLGEDNMPREVLDRYWNNNPFPRRSTLDAKKDTGYYGLAGPRNQRVWHLNPEGSAPEEFADTFLAWTMGAWETEFGRPTRDAYERINFMDQWMPLWVDLGASE
jgi:RHS repeat-associated protein